MKSEIFIHCYKSNKATLKKAKEIILVLFNKLLENISQALSVTQFYYQEIAIQTKVFRTNLKQINRF